MNYTHLILSQEQLKRILLKYGSQNGVLIKTSEVQMKFKKILALLLCVILMTAIFAGCSQTVKSPLVSADTAASASPSGALDASASPATLNFAGAYTSLDPKTVMLTINDKDVTWEKMYYFIYYVIYELQAQGYEITDWSEIYIDDITYMDYVIDYATSFALQYAALEYGAGQEGVTLTDADKAAVQASWDERVTSAGSEEAFVADLQSKFCSKEFFMELLGYSKLAQGVFASMYGVDGSTLTEEQLAEYTAQDGYLMTKHILMLTTKTDESGAETAMTDAEKTVVRTKMEDILSQLKSYTGDDFDTYYDELMNTYSEDKGGLASFPDGYLFQNGDMVSAFYDTANALEIGKFSDIVESDFGYHIIYRIPLNYDVTPSAYASSGNYSLRLLTAQNMFSAVADAWMNSLNVVESEQYKSLDLSKMFAVG